MTHISFYVDSERLVGHALETVAPLIKANTDMSVTFWVYGSADKSTLENNGVKYHQFLPFEKRHADVDSFIKQSAQSDSPAPILHKSYAAPDLKMLWKQGQKSLKRRKFSLARIIINPFLYIGAIIVLAYLASRKAYRAIRWGVKKVIFVFRYVWRGVLNTLYFILRQLKKFRDLGQKAFAKIGNKVFSVTVKSASLGSWARWRLVRFLRRLTSVVSTAPQIIGIATISLLSLGIGSARRLAQKIRLPANTRESFRERIRRFNVMAVEMRGGTLPQAISRRLRLGRFAASSIFLRRLNSVLVKGLGGVFMVFLLPLKHLVPTANAKPSRLLLWQQRLNRALETLREKRASKVVQRSSPTVSKHSIDQRLQVWRAKRLDAKQEKRRNFLQRRNKLLFEYAKNRDAILYALRQKYYVTRNSITYNFQAFVRKIPPNDLLAFISRHHNGFDYMILHDKPDIVMLLESNIETTSHLLTKRLWKSGIETIIVPFTIPNPDEAASFYFNDKSRQVRGLFSMLVAQMFPEWAYSYKGQKMLRFRATKVLTYEALDLGDKRPWIPNHGPVTKILIESQAMKDIYLSYGFDEGQLAQIGSATDDKLLKLWRQRHTARTSLCAQFGWDPSKPILLCAFPPDQYSDKLDQFEYKTFEDMILGWRRLLIACAPFANVIIRPHPRVDSKRLRDMMGPEIIISDEPTLELVPICDIYLACISATIRWALSLGLPVVNYDCYRYRYKDYEKSGAMATVENERDCGNVLIDWLSDPAKLETIASIAEAEKRYWGYQERESTEKLQALINKIL